MASWRTCRRKPLSFENLGSQKPPGLSTTLRVPVSAGEPRFSSPANAPSRDVNPGGQTTAPRHLAPLHNLRPPPRSTSPFCSQGRSLAPQDSGNMMLSQLSQSQPSDVPNSSLQAFPMSQPRDSLHYLPSQPTTQPGSQGTCFTQPPVVLSSQALPQQTPTQPNASSTSHLRNLHRLPAQTTPVARPTCPTLPQPQFKHPTNLPPQPWSSVGARPSPVAAKLLTQVSRASVEEETSKQILEKVDALHAKCRHLQDTVTEVHHDRKVLSKLEVGFVELRDDVLDMKRILGNLQTTWSVETKAKLRPTRDQGTLTESVWNAPQMPGVARESETQHEPGFSSSPMKPSATPQMLQGSCPDNNQWSAHTKRGPAVVERTALKQPFKLCLETPPSKARNVQADSPVCPGLNPTSIPRAQETFVETFQDRLSSPSLETSSPVQSVELQDPPDYQGAAQHAPLNHLRVEQEGARTWDGRRGEKRKHRSFTRQESPPMTRGRASRAMVGSNLQLSQEQGMPVLLPPTGDKRLQQALHCKKVATKHTGKSCCTPAQAKCQVGHPRQTDQTTHASLNIFSSKKEIEFMPAIDDSELKRLVEARLRRHRLKTYGKL